MKVFIAPQFRGEDKGDGGIRRIVEAQRLWLPKLGVEVVDDIGQADLIATHAGSAPSLAPSAPWVSHCHGLYWSEYEWDQWHHKLNRGVIDAMRLADRVTAPSEWVAQALRRGMWLDPTMLHHGINFDEWEPSQNPEGYILWNKSRPDPVCDPASMIDLAARTPDLAYVTTFGGATPNIRVTGRMPFDRMRELVKEAGVYLCTTRETFGIGTIEAMACGVPVVGWAWGGQREIIEHGVTGWLATPGDYESLEEGVRWALANRLKVGTAARDAVKAHWTWDTIMPLYVDLYQRVYDDKQRRNATPAVSVIVPTYNLSQYLPDTIASLQAQTFQDWEAIIVDDSSPDTSYEVALQLAAEDNRIRVIRNPENLYLAGTLNAGIKEARGRYILPLDADNMIEPGTLAILSGALDSNRGIDIAYGACRFVLEDGWSPDTEVSPNGASGWPQLFSFAQQMQHRNQIPSTCMYRREVWERSGGYRRRHRTAEDAEFWTRVTSLGFVPDKVTSQITLIYRNREDSMSRVEAEPDWTAWFPWSRRMALVPFGVHEKPRTTLNYGQSWHVPSAEPAKIAVVIPVGPGHEELVIDALDSVEAQNFRQWECIVVNDTGEPLDIPHTWAKVIEPDDDPASDNMYHIFQLDLQESGLCHQCGEDSTFHVSLGPARARNLGIAASTARLFVPLDADDYLQADALDEMFATWEQFGGVVYAQWHDDLGDRTQVYDPPDYDASLLVSKGVIHGVTALYPKAAWEKVGGFDEELSHWEDWDFQIKLADIGVCGTKVPLPLWTYRKTTGARREDNMAAFNQGRDTMMKKWPTLWGDGPERKQLMACQGCPGGGGARYARPPAVQQQSGMSGGGVVAPGAPRPRAGYAFMKFLGESPGTVGYNGKVTGTKYKFGNTPSHRFKYVHEQDAPGLLAIVGKFEIVATPEVQADPREVAMGQPQMVAAGPPSRIDEAQAAPVPHTPDMPLTVAVAAPPPVEESPKSNPNTFNTLNRYTVRDLKAKLPEWDAELVGRYLDREREDEHPRVAVITALETRLRQLTR